MSAIRIPGFMCDDEMGCGDFTSAPFEEVVPHDWGVATRDITTEHLCWDCVYAANDDWWIERGHYLSAPTATLPTPIQGGPR